MPQRQWIRATTVLFGLSLLAFLPTASDRFVLPKLTLALAAIACGAMSQRRGHLPGTVLAIGGVGLAWLGLTALLSEAPAAALLGRWPRYEGIPVLLAYAGAAWLGARTWQARQATQPWPRVLSLAALALGLVSLAETAGLSVIGDSVETRTGSVLGNATDQGLTGMLLAGVLGGLALRHRDRLLVAGASSGLLTVALSGSRAALLGSLVVAGVLIIRHTDRRGRLLVGGSLAVVAAVALLVPATRERLLSGRTVMGRRLLWEESLDLIGDHLAVGVGPSGFVDAIGRYHGDAWVTRVGIANPPDSPHSWPLQAAAAGGLPLLLIALAGLAVVSVLGWRAIRVDPDRIVLAAPLAGFTMALLTHFTSAAPTLLAALLAGALIAVPVKRDSPESPVEPRIVAAISGVLAVITLAGTLAGIPLQRGLDSSRDGRVARAEARFDTAQRWRPWDRELARFAAQALTTIASSGKTPARGPAREWAERATRQLPTSGEAGLALASLDVLAGELPLAEARLDRIIEANPTMAAAFVQRALARFGQGNPEGAFADLDEALRLDPANDVVPGLRAQMEQRLQVSGR